jgi:glycosyltransferase involved in cell wall biosynthesis
MKKVLFVNNQLGGGGAERVLIMIANYLASCDNEYNVSILTLHKTEKKYDIDNRVHVKEITSGNNGLLKIIRLIREQILTEKPDVVISFEYHMNMKVIIASVGIKNMKIVISERNDPSRKGGHFPLRQIRNILYRKADWLVCQTPDAKEYFPLIIQKNTVVIPNPIKADLPQMWEGERKKEIINFCRLEPQKNLKLLIDAFNDFSKEYNEYILTIYGDGSLHDELEAYVLNLGIQNKVTLHPAVSDIHERIKDVAMFVSSSDFEGLSNSMLEAMALGIPTICTDCPCGGARMVIKDGENGILIPASNKNEMVKAMKRIASDSDFAQKIGEEASLIRRRLNISIICNAWMEIIN